MASALRKLKTDLHAILYDENKGGKLTRLLGVIEKKTGVNRTHTASALGGILALYLVLGPGAQLVCNAISFAYPAYASFQMIRSMDKEKDEIQWVTYWCIFGFLGVLDFFAEGINSVVPVYWLLKCIFLFYLYAPEIQGARGLYEKAIEPLLALVEAKVVVRVKDGRKVVATIEPEQEVVHS